MQLPEQTVGSNFVPPGTVGVIGSGTLINYNPVLVDYTEGELFLGQGNQAQSAASERPISKRVTSADGATATNTDSAIGRT